MRMGRTGCSKMVEEPDCAGRASAMRPGAAVTAAGREAPLLRFAGPSDLPRVKSERRGATVVRHALGL